ncbi:MAG TPA: hypothetical protein VK168_13705 [Saprospiraceae bacterium]|nr:hypothetical protein [Saprospiraceae bacterium]
MSHKNDPNEPQYVFSTATAADNADILELLRRSPIRMEMDYVMDRQNNFFLLHDWLPETRVLLARDAATGELQGFLSLLKLRGMVDGREMAFQYVTDLIKAPENRSPFLMKRLLNYGFVQYFDTPLIFGLINARNNPARRFSTSVQLQYPGDAVHAFHYLEMAPLWRQRISRRYSLRQATDQASTDQALVLINRHYERHALFQPLNRQELDRQFEVLPGFSAADVWLLEENGQQIGAMITYRPDALSSLILMRMDGWSRFLFRLIRGFHRITGLLFDPPEEGGHIRTLQVRYLAGNEEARRALLRAANNMAYTEKRHSVSMLLDAADPLEPSSWVTYRYQSLLYANGRDRALVARLKEGLVWMDVVWG